MRSLPGLPGDDRDNATYEEDDTHTYTKLVFVNDKRCLAHVLTIYLDDLQIFSLFRKVFFSTLAIL